LNIQELNVIKAVLFDFGGVIAEEGFYLGLRAVAEENNLDPDAFFKTAEDIIHETGYVTGKADEEEYWDAVRFKTGLKVGNGRLREQVLSRFTVRPEMLAHADRLRASGRTVCILSDQTDWLDELNGKTPFYGHFDRVFNSYFLHKSKRDATVFRDVCSELDMRPEEALFVDDNINNIKRAAEGGMNTIHFIDTTQFAATLAEFGLGVESGQE
jgi:putative hydrolase of the HAD superfamily